MAEVIYKYDVPCMINKVYIPEGAKVLSIGLQDNKPVIWALVDTDREPTIRIFRAVHTGTHDFKVDEELEFIGTVQFDSGFVAHYFEVIDGYRD